MCCLGGLAEERMLSICLRFLKRRSFVLVQAPISRDNKTWFSWSEAV